MNSRSFAFTSPTRRCFVLALLLTSLLLAACGSGGDDKPIGLIKPEATVAYFRVDRSNAASPTVLFVARVKNTGARTLQQMTVEWQFKTAGGTALGESRRFTLPNVGAGQTIEFVASETSNSLKARAGEAGGVDITVVAPGLPVDQPGVAFLKATDIALSQYPTPALQYDVTATVALPSAPVAANRLQRWVILQDANGRIVGGDGGGLLSDASLATLPAGSAQKLTFQAVPAESEATKAVVYAYVQELP